MADYPYCEQSFADESDIREHLYEDHEYDELDRIDTKRVDEYVDEHNQVFGMCINNWLTLIHYAAIKGGIILVAIRLGC